MLPLLHSGQCGKHIEGDISMYSGICLGLPERRPVSLMRKGTRSMQADSCQESPRSAACEFDTHFKVFHELMAGKVLDILLVASAYDAYILEEDGSLASKIINEYRGLNLSRPPRITRVESARKAFEAIEAGSFDLVIVMPLWDDMDPFDLGHAIKRKDPDLPVIILSHTLDGLYPIPAGKNTSGVDQIFVWTGDADLLLAIVKNVEDRINVARDTERAQVRILILVEDSPLYRSFFLPMIYKEVVHQTQAVLEESLNEEHRLLKMRARPKILVAENMEEALALFERYKPYLFGVISDTRFPCEGQLCEDAGYRLLRGIKEQIPDLPILLLSSEPENRTKAERLTALFVDKNDQALFDQLHGFFLDQLGFGDFIFRHADGREVARASNLRQLEAILPSIPDEPLCYHASRNRFSNWIMARSEIELASRLRRVKISDFPDTDSLRDFLIASIHSLRQWRQKGVVIQFKALSFEPQMADFAKIGKGSLGGKARGLAFASHLLRQSPGLLNRFPDISIRIPTTLVITTEGFDQFVQTNRLTELSLSRMDNSQIETSFVNSRMPDSIKSDLSAYLEAARFPLAIRSSSLLEDARQNPATGLYRTYLLSNNHPDKGVRLAELITAVKRVLASSWFDIPRQFAHGTAYAHRREQMAVMIQQVVGRRYGNFFYPALSGVARSHNYYPFGPIRPEDGMAEMTLGFGRAGKAGLRFCPLYPELLPAFSKVEDILKNVQTHFYALPMVVGGTEVVGNMAGAPERRSVADALEEAPVKRMCSTYIPEEHRLRDSAITAGHRVLTFAAVLKHRFFPLAELLAGLLEVGRREMGCPMELEFAVLLNEGGEDTAEFNLLQLRPMPVAADPYELVVTEGDKEQALCYATQALGHGRFDQMADIVYVRPEAFDPARTVDMASEISKINAILKADRRPYLLIGPGRWGSFDPWLGIPVKWEHIDGVGAMVELRTGRLKADPSQGSHFFHQITALNIPYLTITEEGPDRLDRKQLDRLMTVWEGNYLRHVRSDRPMLLKCDGRRSECVILFPVLDGTNSSFV